MTSDPEVLKGYHIYPKYSPQLLTILLKFEKVQFTTQCTENLLDEGQTVWPLMRRCIFAASYLGLHFLLRPVCLNTHGKLITSFSFFHPGISYVTHRNCLSHVIPMSTFKTHFDGEKIILNYHYCLI